MYRVLIEFADLKDDKFLYHVGDVFPRDGAKVSSSRINELLGKNNNLGKPIIEVVEEPKKQTSKKKVKEEDAE